VFDTSSELRDIANQIREMTAEKNWPYAHQAAGHLLSQAFARGAFSGTRYLQLHRLFEISQYSSHWPYRSMFFAVVGWLIKHRDKLPNNPRTTWYEGKAMEGGVPVREYFHQNIRAVADLIESLAESAPNDAGGEIIPEPKIRTKPQELQANPPQQANEVIGEIDPNARMSHPDIAKHFNLTEKQAERLRKRLDRWRGKNALGGGWVEDPMATIREARYLYHIGSVIHLIDDAVREKP